MLSQHVRLAFALIVCAIPIWFGFAWVTGMIRFGPEPVMEGAPAFEQTTTRGVDDLRACLLRDYSGGLSLFPAYSPPGMQLTRLRNSSTRVIVDISAANEGAVVRVYRLDGRPLRRRQALAVQSCIPENALPNPMNPRNRDFYEQ